MPLPTFAGCVSCCDSLDYTASLNSLHLNHGVRCVLQVFHPRTGAPLYTLTAGAVDAMPITAIRWRPLTGGKTKNVAIVASADGIIKHWHVRTSTLTNIGSHMRALTDRISMSSFHKVWLLCDERCATRYSVCVCLGGDACPLIYICCACEHVISVDWRR